MSKSSITHEFICIPLDEFIKEREAFIVWLTNHGAKICLPSNGKEFLRFGTSNDAGTGVVVVKKSGKEVKMIGSASTAWDAYKNNKECSFIGISKKNRLKDFLAGRDGGWQCWYCRRKLDYTTATLEHFVPLCRGGRNNIHNLVLACQPCNNKVGCKNITEKIAYKRSVTRHPSAVVYPHTLPGNISKPSVFRPSMLPRALPSYLFAQSRQSSFTTAVPFSLHGATAKVRPDIASGCTSKDASGGRFLTRKSR